MDLIAHRGLINNNISENTIPAFLNAINNGYAGIELDIRLTKDNKIVVIHDKFINRTSNGKGNINNILYKDLLKYNFGTKNKNTFIPLLKDVVKAINNKVIIIELKEKIEPVELIKILKYNNSNDYYISSFNKDYINYLGDISYKKGLINYIFNSFISLEKYDFVLILESLFSEDIYNYLNKINVEPIIYNTGNSINIKDKKNINTLKYIV